MDILESRPARPRRKSRRTALAAGMAALATVGGCFAQVDENSLKAAFVYNIIAFSQWDHPPDDPLTICVQTNPALLTAMGTLQAKRLDGRRLLVTDGSMPSDCDVRVHGAQTSVTPAADVLVICDACQLPNHTSAVALVREGNKLRFDVDVARARSDRILLSSQLLRLARRVL
jgi:hypothetical protein